MKLASCDNCAHRNDATCSLGLAPPTGEFLCHRYAMTTTFRDEVIQWARKEIAKDVNQAMLEIAVMRAEKDKAYAG